MNLLAHLWLAERTDTSFAGQILGDRIKGRLDERLPAATRQGVRLHRSIDSFSDAHVAHRTMRACFSPPYRRYAGILVDIGFDYSLARAWRSYADRPLTAFAAAAERRVRDEWPKAGHGDSDALRGLADVLTGYRSEHGIQRALDSVAGRLRRANPLRHALPAVTALTYEFDAALPRLMTDLERHVAIGLEADRA